MGFTTQGGPEGPRSLPRLTDKWTWWLNVSAGGTVILGLRKKVNDGWITIASLTKPAEEFTTQEELDSWVATSADQLYTDHVRSALQVKRWLDEWNRPPASSRTG